jgi:hypothetical protein
MGLMDGDWLPLLLINALMNGVGGRERMSDSGTMQVASLRASYLPLMSFTSFGEVGTP